MTSANDGEQLGSVVRGLRATRGLSIRRLAARAGVDATWLMRLEKNAYRSPDGRLLRRVAEALNVSPSDLLVPAGFEDPESLPQLKIYLRSKYELPDEAVAQLQAHFDLLSYRYRRDRGDVE